MASFSLFHSPFATLSLPFTTLHSLRSLSCVGIIFNTRAVSMCGVGGVWKGGVGFLWFNGLDCHNFVWVLFLIPVQQGCAVLGGEFYWSV